MFGLNGEVQFNPEFMRFLNQATDVVANNFAKNFVDHCRVFLAPHVISEFCLDH